MIDKAETYFSRKSSKPPDLLKYRLFECSGFEIAKFEEVHVSRRDLIKRDLLTIGTHHWD